MAVNLDNAMDIRTAYRAEEGAAGVQSLYTAVRSTSSTSGAFTSDTRSERQGAAGVEGDLFFENDTGLVYYADTGTSWKYLTGIGFGANAARAGLTITADDNGAWWFVTDAGVNYGLWRVVAGVWVKELLSASPDVATSYRVAGNDVVKARGAAIADAAGGVTVDAEARSAINALLAHFRTWGAIAP